MRLKELPCIDRLNELFYINENSGRIFRKISVKYNAKKGQEAGVPRHDGYKVLMVDGEYYLSHRIAYKMYHGTDPNGIIDHINRDCSNNSKENLRDTTSTVNMRNIGIRSNNKSGVTGVSWFSSCNKWRATAYIKRKQIHLGLFERKEDAIQARRKYEESVYLKTE